MKNIVFSLFVQIAIIFFSVNAYAFVDADILRNIGKMSEVMFSDEEAINKKNESIRKSLKYKKFFVSVNDMSVIQRPMVSMFVNRYTDSSREELIESIRRSSVYLPLIDEVFMKYPDVPKDLRLLPLLESGFIPLAVSRAGATGLWQFMLETSSGLGLETNVWVDERRNIIRSTDAAIRHLKYLYSVYGSWELALSAYNAGESNVNSVLNDNPGVSYWELVEKNCFNQETNEYVARFAALLVIYKNRGLFNLEMPFRNDKLEDTERMVFDFPVLVGEISKFSHVSVDQIKKLNPDLRRGITPPYRSYEMVLPTGAVELLEKNKEKLYKMKYTKIIVHSIKKGDTLGKIAKIYGSKTSAIILINDISSSTKLKPGTKLFIPI